MGFSDKKSSSRRGKISLFVFIDPLFPGISSLRDTFCEDEKLPSHISNYSFINRNSSGA